MIHLAICFFLSILAAVSSNYNDEIGGLRTEVAALKQEIVELTANTVPTTPAIQTTTATPLVTVPTTSEIPSTTVNGTNPVI